ncbi:MAG: NADH-quinone oxidoreductase subunit NuoK [Bdellovibrionota bacterium]|nr:MAG: NADH-quinone oxidoreductase subunit NuoK [Bdellovibrionota bacterium]
MIPVSFYLTLAALMFTIGVCGVAIRRNVIVVFMCIELMLNAVNLSMVAFSRTVGNLDGQIGVFFVMVVAAAEAAIGLGIIIALFRSTRSLESSEASELRR